VNSFNVAQLERSGLREVKLFARTAGLWADSSLDLNGIIEKLYHIKLYQTIFYFTKIYKTAVKSLNL